MQKTDCDKLPESFKNDCEEFNNESLHNNLQDIYYDVSLKVK